MSTQLVGIAETAKVLGVSKDTVRRLIKSGELRAVHIGRRLLVPDSEVVRVCARGVGEGQKAEAANARNT